jgi:CRISPR/Cas system-associated exonuclease Cas4 (RecB family)
MDIECDIPLIHGGQAIVTGRLDMYDWRASTIIDLKTTKFIRWQKEKKFIPRTEHIIQIQCYYTIFSQKIPVENLNLVYVDLTDVITYDVPRKDLSKWITSRVYGIEDSLLNNSVPAGETSELCKFCRYQTRCYNTGNGLPDKPQSVPVEHL